MLVKSNTAYRSKSISDGLMSTGVADADEGRGRRLGDDVEGPT